MIVQGRDVSCSVPHRDADRLFARLSTKLKVRVEWGPALVREADLIRFTVFVFGTRHQGLAWIRSNDPGTALSIDHDGILQCTRISVGE